MIVIKPNLVHIYLVTHVTNVFTPVLTVIMLLLVLHVIMKSKIDITLQHVIVNQDFIKMVAKYV